MSKNLVGLIWIGLEFSRERKDMVMNIFESRKRSLMKLIYTATVKWKKEKERKIRKQFKY